MKTLEQLNEIVKLDSSVQFFVDNYKELQHNSPVAYITELYYSNAIGIELENNSFNYRIYDPFGQVTSQYRNADGFTNWSVSDPMEEAKNEIQRNKY